MSFCVDAIQNNLSDLFVCFNQERVQEILSNEISFMLLVDDSYPNLCKIWIQPQKFR